MYGAVLAENMRKNRARAILGEILPALDKPDERTGLPLASFVFSPERKLQWVLVGVLLTPQQLAQAALRFAQAFGPGEVAVL